MEITEKEYERLTLDTIPDDNKDAMVFCQKCTDRAGSEVTGVRHKPGQCS